MAAAVFGGSVTVIRILIPLLWKRHSLSAPCFPLGCHTINSLKASNDLGCSPLKSRIKLFLRMGRGYSRAGFQQEPISLSLDVPRRSYYNKVDLLLTPNGDIATASQTFVTSFQAL